MEEEMSILIVFSDRHKIITQNLFIDLRSSPKKTQKGERQQQKTNTQKTTTTTKTKRNPQPPPHHISIGIVRFYSKSRLSYQYYFLSVQIKFI
jgi:hypothetical protein